MRHYIYIYIYIYISRLLYDSTLYNIILIGNVIQTLQFTNLITDISLIYQEQGVEVSDHTHTHTTLNKFYGCVLHGGGQCSRKTWISKV